MSEHNARKEIMNIQDVGEALGCPPGINIIAFARHVAEQAALYRFIRDEDSWGDDGPRSDWLRLGELDKAGFDAFVKARMKKVGDKP